MPGTKPVVYSKLNGSEQKDPMRVIAELFDFADIDDAKSLLWEWLKTTVTGTYHKNLSASERTAIVALYEKLEKLIEAAHIMHEKSPAEK